MNETPIKFWVVLWVDTTFEGYKFNSVAGTSVFLSAESAVENMNQVKTKRPGATVSIQLTSPLP